jgi:hypothetical protein
MTDAFHDDRALVDSAREALERSEFAHRHMADMALPGAPPEWVTDQAILAEEAAHHAQQLADFDVGQRVDVSGLRSIWAGEEALRREAAGYRALSSVTTDERWHAEFRTSAEEADREADRIEELRHRLFHRDRAAEPEIER